MIAQLARTLIPAAISLMVAIPLQHVQAAEAVFVRSHDVFTDGQRQGRFDTFSDGAHRDAAKVVIAGLDRSGMSAAPARSFDPYTDGARAVEGDPRPRGTALNGATAWV